MKKKQSIDENCFSFSAITPLKGDGYLLICNKFNFIFYSDTAAIYLFLFFSLFNLGNGTAILELLLNAGADLNAITAWGDTAAHYAALTGKTLAKPF